MIQYNKERPLRVFTAFSGYDSQCLALDRLKETFPEFEYELVGWSEIDKYAIQAHNALYPQWADRNYGDISKTQQYKMAGNSIVVNVLYHIFRKMFVENVPPQRTQTTLF